jgi:hypothetical protein
MFHNARRQVAGHEVKRPEDIHQIVAIQIAHDGAVPFEPQGRPQAGDHREARLILTQQHELAGVSFFLMPGAPAAPSPAGPGQL